MKRRGLLAGIAALAALAVCLILYWLAPVKTRAEGELVLWYAGTDCPAEGMDALAARCEKESGLHVEAVGFPDTRWPTPSRRGSRTCCGAAMCAPMTSSRARALRPCRRR